MDNLEQKKRRGMMMIKGYPVALIVVAVIVNFLLLGVDPLNVTLPSRVVMLALTISGGLLLFNHTWLMTSTELARAKFDIETTPEEWEESGRNKDEVTTFGQEELERRHNAHRNATENTVYFVFLAFIFALSSPSDPAALVWMIGFGVARLGHTFSYLNRNTPARGVFMSLSLLSLYGMFAYLVFGFLI